MEPTDMAAMSVSLLMCPTMAKSTNPKRGTVILEMMEGMAR